MPISCKARILVIDNDPRVGRDLKKFLELRGYNVSIVEGEGLELINSAKERTLKIRPHVIVMDLRLVDDEDNKDRSGLELWKDQVFQSARCILYSAYLQEDYTITRDAFSKAGIDDVVLKGDSPQRLIEAVDTAARKKCACNKGFHIQWPTAFDPEQVVESLFGKGSGVPADLVSDVLGQLFPDTEKLILKTLEGAAISLDTIARGRSVLLKAWSDDREPVVVKLAPAHSTVREVDAYQKYVGGHLVGLFHAQLQGHVTFWDIGGIRYSFIGSSLRTIKTFATFYQNEKDAEAIMKPLRHFFETVWQHRYQYTRVPLDSSLFDAYDRYLKLRQRLLEFPNQGKTVAFPGLRGGFSNPIRWVLAHESDSYLPAIYQAVTHGDLHGDNLFAEGEHAWAIDFERSGPGPILRDFVELEQDIITRLALLPNDDLPFFYEFVVVLTTPQSPDVRILPTSLLEKSEEARKALDVIAQLRHLAQATTNFLDIQEYYWGLLMDALVGSSLAAEDSPKRQRALLLAAILCGRLQNWDKNWPPQDWPPIQWPTQTREAVAPSGTLKVLFLSANPATTDRLKLDEEERAIKHVLARANIGDRIMFVSEWALRISELSEYLLKHQPTIVHFSGHGSAEGRLIFKDERGDAFDVPIEALSRLFAICKDNIRCVLLNACYSIAQAEAIAQHIDVVIGMPTEIDDNAAQKFAAEFYKGLVYKRNVKECFDLGCVAIDLHKLPKFCEPKLICLRYDSKSLYLA